MSFSLSPLRNLQLPPNPAYSSQRLLLFAGLVVFLLPAPNVNYCLLLPVFLLSILTPPPPTVKLACVRRSRQCFAARKGRPSCP